MKYVKVLIALLLCVVLSGCQTDGKGQEGGTAGDLNKGEQVISTPVPTDTPIPISTPTMVPMNTPTPVELPTIMEEEEIPMEDRYTVIGNINGDEWTKDLPMERQQDGTWITTEIYVLNAGEEFKVRKGCSWNINFGAEGANGANFHVEDSGTYKIKLTLMGRDEGRIELVAIDPLTPIPTVVLSKMEYEPSVEWETVSSNSFAVQIDDVLYVPLISVAEFIEKVDSSSVDYIVWYDPNKTVAARTHDYTIEIYRDGEMWFTAKVCNPLTEQIKLSEAIVIEIQPSEIAMGHCYFIDGRSYEELSIMNYQEIKDMVEQVFPKDVYSEEEIHCWEYESTWGKSYFNQTEVMVIRIRVKRECTIEKDDWLYTYNNTTLGYEFKISKATQKNLEFSVAHGSGETTYTAVLQGEPIKSLSEITEKEQETLVKTAENNLKLYGTYVTEMLGCYLVENEDNDSTSLIYVADGKDRYGVHRCARIQFNEVERKKDGTLSFNGGKIMYKECSVEQYLTMIKEENINMLDSNINFEWE